jgi:hypothetical protein
MKRLKMFTHGDGVDVQLELGVVQDGVGGVVRAGGMLPGPIRFGIGRLFQQKLYLNLLTMHIYLVT